VEAAALVKRCRQQAGLTQAELGRRIGTTQSAVARLEGPESNPRLETLESALRATGNELHLRTRPLRAGIDEAQILDRLQLTPAERLAAFQASSAGIRRLLDKASAPHARSA
jgi:transcriptional regulator with XRE-family HTH domain